MQSRFTRSIGLCFIITALLSTASFGQNRPGGQGGGQGGGQRGRGDGSMLIDRLQKIVDELNPTDDQKAKLEPIYTKAKADLKEAIESSRDMDRQERGAKLKETMDGIKDQIKSVLTDDQKKQFDEKAAQMQTGPGGGQGRGQGQGQGGQNNPRQALQRFRDAVNSLDLTDDQKPKVEAALKDAQDKFQQARQESNNDQQAMREKTRAIVEDLGVQIRGILTAEQNQKLQEAMRPSGGNGRGDRNGPSTGPTTKPSGGDAGSMLPTKTLPGVENPGAPPDPNDRLEVGQAAPDFHLTKLDGLPVQLSSFKDKIFLLAFGSYTSPSFRQRAAALESLRREFGVRLNFLVVYTREAHPAGGWEVDRNHDLQINIPDHTTEIKRRDVAREARDRLQLREMMVAVDSMDDAAAKAYHGWPNDAAVLVGKDGRVLAYQRWFDADAMKSAIVDALGPK